MSENKKISELDLVTSNASGDMFPLVQSGVTMRTTLSKISAYLGGIFTTPSAVSSQITTALGPYATTLDLNTGLGKKQDKQQLDEVSVNADTVTTLNSSNCILSVTNLPNNGNKEIKMRLSDGLFESSDTISISLIYKGFDINLRSYAIYEEDDGISISYLSIYVNVHSDPTEPVLISINKSN